MMSKDIVMPDHWCRYTDPCAECKQVAALAALAANSTDIEVLSVFHDDKGASFVIEVRTRHREFKARLDQYWNDLWGCNSDEANGSGFVAEVELTR